MTISEIIAKHLKRTLYLYIIQKMNRYLGAIDAIESIAKDMGYTIYVCEMTDSGEVMIEYEGEITS